MTADIEPGPIIGLRNRRRLYRHGVDDRHVSSVTVRLCKNADCRDTTQCPQNCFDIFDHRVRHDDVFDQEQIGIRPRQASEINLASKTVVSSDAVDSKRYPPARNKQRNNTVAEGAKITVEVRDHIPERTLQLELPRDQAEGFDTA